MKLIQELLKLNTAGDKMNESKVLTNVEKTDLQGTIRSMLDYAGPKLKKKIGIPDSEVRHDAKYFVGGLSLKNESLKFDITAKSTTGMVVGDTYGVRSTFLVPAEDTPRLLELLSKGMQLREEVQEILSTLLNKAEVIKTVEVD